MVCGKALAAANGLGGIVVANPAVELSPAASAVPVGYQPARADMASLPLGPAPSSARTARDFTAAVLGTWGLADALPDAHLVVSELVTNALRYGLSELPAPGLPRSAIPFIRLRLVRSPAGLRCEVTDPSDVMPTCLAPDENTEIGRGLCLVAALCHQWGATSLPNGGKCVWADLRVAP
jgi:anti-sigma regulatory factor (Ser/Thr protein kinase)